MTVTIATPDRRTVAALARTKVDPARITACLRRVSSSLDGARVVAAQCVALPFDPQAHSFSVLGELQLPAATSWASLERVASALARELQRAGFAIE